VASQKTYTMQRRTNPCASPGFQLVHWARLLIACYQGQVDEEDVLALAPKEQKKENHPSLQIMNTRPYLLPIFWPGACGNSAFNRATGVEGRYRLERAKSCHEGQGHL